MTNDTTRTNLDKLCAELGQQIASAKEDGTLIIKEDLIRETLGVLQEDGVYACFLFLLAKQEKGRKKLKQFLSEFLKKNDLISRDDIKKDNAYVIIGQLAESLDKLLFAKFLLERVLIYARYHAKAYAE